mmetsp:Transcript_2476/g.4916  ORF Transcript_2476/g.4916 Transcript_2476/m.4916 type:complete len:201 (+) Transcript_2476:1541-2143(+)
MPPAGAAAVPAAQTPWSSPGPPPAAPGCPPPPRAPAAQTPPPPRSAARPRGPRGPLCGPARPVPGYGGAWWRPGLTASSGGARRGRGARGWACPAGRPGPSSPVPPAYQQLVAPECPTTPFSSLARSPPGPTSGAQHALRAGGARSPCRPGQHRARPRRSLLEGSGGPAPGRRVQLGQARRFQQRARARPNRLTVQSRGR